MINKSIVRKTFFASFSLLFCALLSAQPDIENGKTLFRNNCAQCHVKNMKDNLTGPALGGVEERWADYPQEDLYDWIRNSGAMIAAGHPRAVELWNEWKPTVMQAFPALTDDDIASLLLYIDGVYTGTYGPATVAGTEVAGAGEEKGSNRTYYIMLFAFLAVLAIVLSRLVGRLRYLAESNAGIDAVKPKSILELLTSKTSISLVIFALVVIGGYVTINNAIALNRQQNYQPEQPIKFSHATHAGLHQVDCQYCHDGARRSKHSVIPAANTCMNCHRAIKAGSTYGTAELSKIFASVGYDPNKDVYIENYDSYSQEDIKKIFTTWFSNYYISQEGQFDAKGERLVEQQWTDLVASLTNENKPQIQGPIEWIRIHNSPDHVYFNHAQHVVAGQVECQECHGPIEEMEVVKQYSTLSMGWCINCHRKTEVQFAGNPYYESYDQYHKEIQMGERDKVTVEDIGGLECQKCHY